MGHCISCFKQQANADISTSSHCKKNGKYLKTVIVKCNVITLFIYVIEVGRQQKT